MIEAVFAIRIVRGTKRYARSYPLGLLANRLKGLVEDPVMSPVGIASVGSIGPGVRFGGSDQGSHDDAEDQQSLQVCSHSRSPTRRTPPTGPYGDALTRSL